MVEEKKQASNSSTAIKVVFCVVYVNDECSITMIHNCQVKFTRSRACKWADKLFTRTEDLDNFNHSFL